MHGIRGLMLFSSALIIALVIPPAASSEARDSSQVAFVKITRYLPNPQCRKGECTTYGEGYKEGVKRENSCDYPQPEGQYTDEWFAGYGAGLRVKTGRPSLCG